MNARIREQSSGRNPLYLKNLAVFSFLIAFFLPLAAHTQTYYYTGKNPMTPMANDAASAIPCDDQAIGTIRYNTATSAFEGCNGVAWADIRNGGAAGAAGLTGQVQFNSGGALAASANFFWDNVNGRLGIGTASPTQSLTINEGGSSATALNIVNLQSNGGSAILVSVPNDSFDHEIRVQNAGSYATSLGMNGNLGYVGSTNNTPFRIETNNIPAIYVTTSQNVGIGTTIPGELLYVSGGNIATTGVYKIGGTTVVALPDADATSIAVGPSALAAQSATNLLNVAVGLDALEYNSTGNGNSALGWKAMTGVSGTPLTNNNNTAMGALALNTLQGVATEDTAVGEAALDYNSTGSYNTAVGASAIQGVTGTPLTGGNNTAVGFSSLYILQGTAANDVAVGYKALEYNSTGNGNTALGSSAMVGVIGTPLTGTGNTAVGVSALYSIQGTAANNTAIGADALEYNSTGIENTAVGTHALNGLSGTPLTGNWNTVMGYNALPAAQGAASKNTAFGMQAGNAVTTGTDNTLVGYEAGLGVTGNSNIVLGEDIGSAITSGNSNILIGNSLTKVTNSSSNQLDIGDAIFASLGNGNVGINTGTAAPGTALDVNGGVTVEPTSVTLTANNTVLATANRSYFQVTSDNTTETNRVFCFGTGTLGQILIIEWTSATNRGEIVSHGNCGGAAGAITASLSFTNWAPKNAETILQLMYNGTHWIQIAGSANY